MSAEMTRRHFIGWGVTALGSLVLPTAAFGMHQRFSKRRQAGNLKQSPAEYLRPIISTIETERQRRISTDPNFYHYVDRELNENRINLLLFIYGESHEPPANERIIIGSHTLISIDTERGLLDKISWTHDIRAPEIERKLQEEGIFDGKARKIDEAYRVGGFRLMRRCVEDATGFIVDAQMATDDSMIVNLVDEVVSGIEVQNSKQFRALPIYFRGIKYPARIFDQAAIVMDGITALQYIKSVPADDQDPQLEHNQRKYMVIRAIQEKLTGLNSLRLINFLREQVANGTIRTDRPLRSFFSNSGIIGSGLSVGEYFLNGGSISDLIPKPNKEIYLVDPAHGDGGMQWVSANAAINPITKQDIEGGIVYPPEPGVEVPFDPKSDFLANPYAVDLIERYWLPLRKRIKELLSN